MMVAEQRKSSQQDHLVELECHRTNLDGSWSPVLMCGHVHFHRVGIDADAVMYSACETACV
jgi:hypothetical protein